MLTGQGRRGDETRLQPWMDRDTEIGTSFHHLERSIYESPAANSFDKICEYFIFIANSVSESIRCAISFIGCD